jgi:hypothetical protein
MAALREFGKCQSASHIAMSPPYVATYRVPVGLLPTGTISRQWQAGNMPLS